MTHRSGFTLLENMLGLMVLMSAIVVMLPLFTQDLILGSMMRERRLAIKLIQSDLDWACDVTQMPRAAFTAPSSPTQVINATDDFVAGTTDFDELRPAVFPPFVAPIELRNAVITRSVTCLDGNLVDKGMNANGTCPGGETLKRVRVTMNWTSRKGNNVSEPPNNAPGTDYLISKVGLCGS